MSSSVPESKMVNSELQYFEARFTTIMNASVDRLANEISELRNEVRDNVAKELTVLRDQEIAQLKILVIELKEKVSSLTDE